VNCLADSATYRLARVYLKNAPILLLDEATSALTASREPIIQKTLYGMMEGKDRTPSRIAYQHRRDGPHLCWTGGVLSKKQPTRCFDQGRL